MTGPRKTLNFKYSAFSDVTTEVWQRANAGDAHSVELIKNTIYEVIDGVLQSFGASDQLSPEDIDEFKNFAFARITSEMPGKHKDTPTLTPILTKFNPDREGGAGAFSTFIWTATSNLYKQFWNAKRREQRKTEKELGREVSLDAPFENSTHTLSDTIEDPHALQEFEDQEKLEDELIMKIVRQTGAAGIQGELGLHTKDSRYMKYLYAFLKASGDKELAREIAFEEFGLQTYKDEIYNMVHNVVRPMLASHFPEYAKLVAGRPAPKVPPPVQEESPLDVTPEEDAELNAIVERGPRQEEEAPIRKIDPKTMQYISGRLNLHKYAIEEMVLFTTIPTRYDEGSEEENMWQDDFITKGITPDDVFNLAADERVILASKSPGLYYDYLAGVVVEFRKPVNQVYPDPDHEGGLYVLDIKPEEILGLTYMDRNIAADEDLDPVAVQWRQLHPGNLMPEETACRLNLKKRSANEIPLQVWRDYQSTDPSAKAKAENQIYAILLNLIRAAVNQYNPQWMSADDREDFIQNEATHFKTYSLNPYDPSIAKFDTFVFNNVKNHLNSAFEQHKRTQKNKPTTSLNAPISEDSGELIDTAANPLSADVLGELSAAGMFQEIVAKLESINPRFPKILNAWMEADGNRHDASKLLIDQGINLDPFTVYRNMVTIRDIIAQTYPEETSMIMAPQKPVQPGSQPPLEEVSTPAQAPVYRIVTDPETGEESKIRISKVKIKGVSPDRLRWADTLILLMKMSKRIA